MATEATVRPSLPWELQGHEAERALLSQLPARAVLLSGPDGVGRRQLARWHAARLNCAHDRPAPCGTCTSCLMWHGGHPDWLEVAPQATTVSGRLNRKPEIRIAQLVEREGAGAEEPLSVWLQRRPLHRFRVGVIDSAHLLTTAAANSFLKMLEEPPTWARIILIAPDLHSLLPTIASRVTALRLGTVDTAGLEPADHPAHVLGTPGPLTRASSNKDAWNEAAAATRDYVSALSGDLHEALTAAAVLEPLWLGTAEFDFPQLLRAELRHSAGPRNWALADEAVARCEEQLAAYVNTGIALQLLTLELRRLFSS